jgi:hypothetical protein
MDIVKNVGLFIFDSVFILKCAITGLCFATIFGDSQNWRHKASVMASWICHRHQLGIVGVLKIQKLLFLMVQF